MNGNGATPLSRPWWRDLPALGEWVPAADVLRSGGFRASAVTRIHRYIAEHGGRVRQVGDAENAMVWVHRDDLHMMAGFGASNILARLRLSGAHRGDLLAEITRPEFDGMDICEIIEELARNPQVVAEAVAAIEDAEQLP